MTRIIQRTITTTIIETLTLIWIHTYDDDQATQNETQNDIQDDMLVLSDIVACSISRVTSSCHTTTLPAYVHALAEEGMP